MQNNQWQQEKVLKRAAALWLAGVMVVSLMGCGKAGGGEGADGTPETGEASAKDGAKGRYVETITDVDTGEIMDLKELSDGRLVLLENGAEGRWCSEDGGKTWEPDVLPGWEQFVQGDDELHSVYDMQAAPDGSVAVLYQSYGSKTGDESMEDMLENVWEWETYIWLIPAEGEEKKIALPAAEEELVKCLCFSEDGSRLFAATSEQRIYEIDREAGTARLFMTADITPDMLCVWENYLAVKNERDGVVIYQLDIQERIEDDVITDFVKANCVVNEQVAESTYSIFPVEGEGIYLACSKGVYRHAIGGTVLEQVINGGLCSLIDPMKHVAKMIRTGEEGFLAAFSEKTLSSFAYDPSISTMPSQTLTAYSLTENDILRQAIIRYQGAYPDVYVEYKVGMDEESGITREDAVKKLNTEIMAGKGPDFLLLDGLPVNSYVEKGMLADLTPYLAELEKEEKLLSNIKESFTTDGKIYMMPAAVTISMYLTDKENMTNVSDLSTLADMIEELRKGHPGEGIMQTYSEEMILNNLMPVSAPLWIKEAGELNTEEMRNYLEQAKRIYDACMEGLDEQTLQRYQDRAEKGINASSKVIAASDLQDGGMQIVIGNEKVTLGELKNAYNYSILQSVNKSENGEYGINCQLALTPGSVKDSFCPYALMGVSAASEKTELAGGLLREMLSEKTQSLLYPNGFPINEAGLASYLKTLGGQCDWAKPGESFGCFAFTGDDGKMSIVNTYMPTEQETKELYNLLSSVRTPYLADAVVEDTVREAGKKYLDGQCSLEEALEDIQEKLAIYMSE